MLLPLLLTGCWKTPEDLNKVDFTLLDYENELLDEPALILTFESDRTCPDGRSAKMFAVYNEGQSDDAPVAVVYHSGAFDYVVEPLERNFLAGTHYQAESRLEASWGADKVWETLGIARDEVDPPEVNDGSMVVALLEQEFVVILPSNCWGDYWHNEVGDVGSDEGAEFFERDGRGMAWDGVRVLTDANFGNSQGYDVPIPWNDELYLIGLGSGGRAVAEVLLRSDVDDLTGVLIDSSPDNFASYTADPLLWGREIEGLNRIFDGDLEDDTLAASSLSQLATDKALPARVAYLWSDLNPRLPVASMSRFANQHGDSKGYWVENTGRDRHVLTNGDLDLARDVTTYLLTGKTP